jgi:hypothetical protein
MLDKAKLGARYTCFKCGTKFYDLNRPLPTCPECGADQRDAPTRDIRSLLGGKGPVKRGKDDEDEVETPADEDDEIGLIEDEDDEDDDAPELDEDEEEEEATPAGGGGGTGEDDW